MLTYCDATMQPVSWLDSSRACLKRLLARGSRHISEAIFTCPELQLHIA